MATQKHKIVVICPTCRWSGARVKNLNKPCPNCGEAQLIFENRLLRIPGNVLAITEVGRQRIPEGYGYSDFRAFRIFNSMVGEVINTPWGYFDIVAGPDSYRLGLINDSGEWIFNTDQVKIFFPVMETLAAGLNTQEYQVTRYIFAYENSFGK